MNDAKIRGNRAKHPKESLADQPAITLSADGCGTSARDASSAFRDQKESQTDRRSMTLRASSAFREVIYVC